MAGHIGDMVSQEWNTPQYIVDQLNWFWPDGIDLDPCDNEHSILNPKMAFRLPHIDGLNAYWDIPEVKSIFVNPPYGRDTERGTSIADWVEKADHTYVRGAFSNPVEVIMLIPASPETKFWFDYIWYGSAGAVCFLKGRVKHDLHGEPAKASSTKGSAVVYWGRRFGDFEEAFGPLGYCVSLL